MHVSSKLQYIGDIEGSSIVDSENSNSPVLPQDRKGNLEDMASLALLVVPVSSAIMRPKADQTHPLQQLSSARFQTASMFSQILSSNLSCL
jgi:hypothetical protein